jgi:signal transduction histidine kinase
MQYLTNLIPLPPSEINLKNLSRSPDIQAVLQHQLQYFVESLPVVAIWITYRVFNQQQRQFVCPEHLPAIVNHSPFPFSLEIEQAFTKKLPSKTLIQLRSFFQFQESEPTNEPLKSRQDGSGCAYIYLFDSAQSDEYFFIETEKPLNQSQQQNLQQQIHLLQDFLRVARESARQQEKIQILEQAVRRGEHQLRNPLALINLYAENLYLSLQDNALQEQALVIRDTVTELSQNLTKLLNCGQKEKLQLIRSNLSELLLETLNILQPQIDAKKLKVSYPNKPLTIAVDGWQIKQVFENILSNAIAFSPCGEVITCNWQVFKNEVLIEISDQGSGIPPEDLKNVFTPFYSKRPGGTGLGLAIAKKIILDHRGSIWVENLVHGGAQFSFTLPRYAPHFP